VWQQARALAVELTIKQRLGSDSQVTFQSQQLARHSDIYENAQNARKPLLHKTFLCVSFVHINTQNSRISFDLRQASATQAA